ncbi:MAG: GNAT family N-acetyltransferase [Alphaproteobacteria bacterium]
MPGLLRQASGADRERVIEWMAGFQKENGDGPAEDTQAAADRRIAAGKIWLWEKDEECVSMAAMTPAVEGVRRLNYVYTPPGQRRQGFAEACVAGLTARLLDQGFRVTLYAGLENPISNSIYRRIGYRAVFDMMHFHFE